MFFLIYVFYVTFHPKEENLHCLVYENLQQLQGLDVMLIFKVKYIALKLKTKSTCNSITLSEKIFELLQFITLEPH